MNANLTVLLLLWTLAVVGILHFNQNNAAKIAKAGGSVLDSTFISNTGTGFKSTLIPSNISASAIQSDGKILVGGYFNSFNSVANNYVVRLNQDGTLDTAFTTSTGAGFDTTINTIAIQSDGKILAGGSFTSFNGTTTNRIARLNTDGTLDTAFTIGIGVGFDTGVNTIAVQTDGKIIIGGDFTSFNSSTNNRIARLNTDGTLDATFTTGIGTGFNNIVRQVAIQTDGKIVAGGDYTSFNATTNNRIARLNTDGTRDTAFTTGIGTGFNNPVRQVAIQADGKIVAGGDFTTFNAISSSIIAKLNTDGTRDTAFTTGIGTGFNNSIISLGIQTDGKILAGGNFTSFNSTTSNRIARLNTGGSIDTTFATGIGTGFNNTVKTLNIQTDGKIVAGGDFTSFNSVSSSTRFTRLLAAGGLDTAFVSNMGTGFNDVYSNGTIHSNAIQADGKIVAGGDYTSFNGTTTNRIARINTNGIFDTTFATGTGFNNIVRQVAIQADGKIVIGGFFTTYNGSAKNYIARLNSDGTLDTSFTIGTGFNGSVNALKIQSDGKILAGGNFTSFNGTSINRLARLNTNGTIDTGLNIGTGFNLTVNSVDVQNSDGKIIAGGAFTTFNGSSRNRIVRLTSAGAFDTSFTIGSGFNGDVRITGSQSDGNIIVGGDFTTYNGNTTNRIARLNFNTGNLDTAFTTAIGSGFNDSINSIAFQSDGKIVIGGNFSTFNGTSINRIAKINTTGARDTTFTSGTGFNSDVRSVIIDSAAKLIIGGFFTN